MSEYNKKWYAKNRLNKSLSETRLQEVVQNADIQQAVHFLKPQNQYLPQNNQTAVQNDNLMAESEKENISELGCNVIAKNSNLDSAYSLTNKINKFGQSLTEEQRAKTREYNKKWYAKNRLNKSLSETRLQEVVQNAEIQQDVHFLKPLNQYLPQNNQTAVQNDNLMAESEKENISELGCNVIAKNSNLDSPYSLTNKIKKFGQSLTEEQRAKTREYNKKWYAKNRLNKSLSETRLQE